MSWIEKLYPGWDYLVVGSSGFSQVGQPDYLKRWNIEKEILLNHLKEKYPVPDEFVKDAMYATKSFDHDFGRYHEVIVFYNSYYLDELEEEDPDKFHRFYDWFNEVESVDLESDELMLEMETKYHEKEIPIKIKEEIKYLVS